MGESVVVLKQGILQISVSPMYVGIVWPLRKRYVQLVTHQKEAQPAWSLLIYEALGSFSAHHEKKLLSSVRLESLRSISRTSSRRSAPPQQTSGFEAVLRTKRRTVRLSAESETEIQDWMSSIRNAAGPSKLAETSAAVATVAYWLRFGRERLWLLHRETFHPCISLPLGSISQMTVADASASRNDRSRLLEISLFWKMSSLRFTDSAVEILSAYENCRATVQETCTEQPENSYTASRYNTLVPTHVAWELEDDLKKTPNCSKWKIKLGLRFSTHCFRRPKTNLESKDCNKIEKITNVHQKQSEQYPLRDANSRQSEKNPASPRLSKWLPMLPSRADLESVGTVARVSQQSARNNDEQCDHRSVLQQAKVLTTNSLISAAVGNSRTLTTAKRNGMNEGFSAMRNDRSNGSGRSSGHLDTDTMTAFIQSDSANVSNYSKTYYNYDLGQSAPGCTENEHYKVLRWMNCDLLDSTSRINDPSSKDKMLISSGEESHCAESNVTSDREQTNDNIGCKADIEGPYHYLLKVSRFSKYPIR